VWDSIDVSRPPLEDSSMFLVTNVIRTRYQERGICPGDPKSDKCPCHPGGISEHGIQTGVCVDGKRCEIHSWCPVEVDEISAAERINGLQTFSLFLRITVKSPDLNKSWDNVAENKMVPGQNLFYLSDLAEQTGFPLASMAAEGAPILITNTWLCDLSLPPEQQCNFTFHFSRVDVGGAETFSPGFNYRYADYYRGPNGQQMRTLYKAYGIFLNIEVHGNARSFSIFELFLHLGSGMSLLALSTVAVDFIAMHFTHRKKFRRIKYVKFDASQPLAGGQVLAAPTMMAAGGGQATGLEACFGWMNNPDDD